MYIHVRFMHPIYVSRSNHNMKQKLHAEIINLTKVKHNTKSNIYIYITIQTNHQIPCMNLATFQYHIQQYTFPNST